MGKIETANVTAAVINVGAATSGSRESPLSRCT